MALTAGTRLGSYEIVSLLGAGGMGEVYRATDTKLGRDVALKILPDLFASDADRVARFRREANVLASLNHPHIASIYGLEEAQPSSGTVPTFLVMELVEGEDLSQRIGRGAIPLDEALPIARQITEALEAAHDAGVIHRDLKPANIKVRADGTVKVLDFGLAKALDDRERSGSLHNLTMSPTMTSPAQMTGVGVILGTAAYMSPEQAKGRAVDRRADVWAFGAVLYEMLTGRRLFEGDDVSETFAAILRAAPEWSALPAATPPAIRRLLRRCLEKDVRARLSDMAMVRIELREADSEPVDTGVATTIVAAPRPSVLRRAAPYAFGIVIAAATGLATWWAARPVETPRAVARFYIDLPDTMPLSAAGRLQVAISPDGTRMVFVANQRLFLRALDQGDPVPIPGTEQGGTGGFARAPFFSPDGQWVGFWQSAQLKKVAVSGGAPVTIGNVGATPVGISWGGGDEILFAALGGVFQVPATGGTPKLLIALKDDARPAYPTALPGGEWVLFLLYPQNAGIEEGQIVAQSRKTGEQRVLVRGASDVRYVAPGYLLYGRGAALMAQPFDVNAMAVSGGPVSVLEGVASLSGTPGKQFAVSSTGALFYLPGGTSNVTASTRLVQIARDGTRSVLIDVGGMGWFPRFSPDGSRVAYGISSATDLSGDSDLWVVEVARGARTRVTFSANNRFYPLWTRDGLRLTFADGSNATNRVLSAPADGSGGVQTLLDVGPRRFPTSWSPDGHVLALYGSKDTSGNNRDLYMWRNDGGKPIQTPFVETPFQERGAIFSPNGKWVAYVSDKSGQNDVFARPFPGPGAEVTISVGGGQEPAWGPSGRELFYRHDRKLLVVRIDESPTSLTVGAPAKVFDDGFVPDLGGAAGGMANYDVAPDGKRFVMVEEPKAANVSGELVRLNVVLNWLDEVKARVPIK